VSERAASSELRSQVESFTLQHGAGKQLQEQLRQELQSLQQQLQQLQRQHTRLSAARDAVVQSLEEERCASRQLQVCLKAASDERDHLAAESARWSAAAEHHQHHVHGLECRAEAAEEAVLVIQGAAQEAEDKPQEEFASRLEALAAERDSLAQSLRRQSRRVNLLEERLRSGSVSQGPADEQHQREATEVPQKLPTGQPQQLQLERQEQQQEQQQDQQDQQAQQQQKQVSQTQRPSQQEPQMHQSEQLDINKQQHQEEQQQQHQAFRLHQLESQLAAAEASKQELSVALENERAVSQQLRLRLEHQAAPREETAAQAAAEKKLRAMQRRLAAARGEEVDEDNDAGQERQKWPDDSCQSLRGQKQLMAQVASLEALRDELSRSVERECLAAESVRAQLRAALSKRGCSPSAQISEDERELDEEGAQGEDEELTVLDETTEAEEATDAEPEHLSSCHGSTATTASVSFTGFAAAEQPKLPRRPFLSNRRSPLSLLNRHAYDADEA